LDADGYILTIENSGLTGSVVESWGEGYYNASGTALTYYTGQVSDDIRVIPRNATTAASLDITALVDVGVIYMNICYVTTE